MEVDLSSEEGHPESVHVVAKASTMKAVFLLLVLTGSFLSRHFRLPREDRALRAPIGVRSRSEYYRRVRAVGSRISYGGLREPYSCSRWCLVGMWWLVMTWLMV